MSDDEPDFMSDEFLAQCVPQDVRPGLMHRHGQKRKHELLKEQEKKNEDYKKKHKSQKQLEQERRDEGLSKAIGEDNIGFKMLQKMGFKPGSNIGLDRSQSSETLKASSSSSVSNTVSKTLKEPIPIVIKTDRKGLGEKTQREEKRLQIEEWRQQRDKLLSDPSQFRNRLREDVLLREIKYDLRRAQSSCKTLDSQNNVEQPSEKFYWPPEPKPEPEDGDEEVTEEVESESDSEDELQPHQQLEILNSYLRTQYFYCIWCGANYEDATDLRESCPGDTRQDH